MEMRLKTIELSGFKSFAKKTTLEFASRITAIVGPNGSGKSNVAEAFRFVLGEQSMKSMRSRRGEDLIWNGSPAAPRAGRASVRLVFDNSDRVLDLDFDQAALERVVHHGGENEYVLNGSQVRLRDIAGLLAGANIGASGHHIISQGEADRILSAPFPLRREMVEDALGLTAYLYKREEAERKLQKTGENIREVESLRRELVPHLKFLGSQVKKIEQAQTLQGELSRQYAEYLSSERAYLQYTQNTLKENRELPESELRELNKKVEHLRKALDKKQDVESGELVELEARGRAARAAREKLGRELGRVEGEISAHTRLAGESGGISAKEARQFGEQVLALAESSRLTDIMALAREFLQKISRFMHSGGAEKFEEEKNRLERELLRLASEELEISESTASMRKKMESENEANRAAERELFAAMARRSELESIFSGVRAQEELLARECERFKEELREAAALLGRDALAYEEHAVFDDEPRGAQEERRRKIERLKIRLEESGTAGAEDVLREHQETTERDQFLARELTDLAKSAQSLRELIGDLTATLETRFKDGIEKINKEFDAFFKILFGGGTASLAMIKEKKLKRGAPEAESEENDKEEDVEVEEGIDIVISLPHKRIKGLHMLSGGERALTSIALIFAMSQVNPPPFLILDETDAALDEANSRRYGDMLENLAKKSQLILITHNRETMSRAGALYGVTMGGDGVSKLLSVKFEEAVAVAK